MPDWTQVSDYQFVSDASARRLAWEFLRRQPRYRELMAQDAALLASQAGPLSPAALTQLRAIRAEIQRSGPLYPRPASSDDPPMFVGNMGVTMLQPKDWPHSRAIFERDFARQEHALWLKLYLDAPLRPQLQAAQRILEREYPETRVLSHRRTPSRRQLIAYLRILDAREAGVPVTRIGAGLFPRQDNSAPERTRDKRLRAMLKAATALRDGGYWSLLAAGKN